MNTLDVITASLHGRAISFDLLRDEQGAYARRPDDVVAAVESGEAVIADYSAWSMMKDGYTGITVMGVDNADEWEEVGLYERHVHTYCEEDGDEYFWDMRYLLIRKAPQAPAYSDVWEDRAEAMGY